MAIKIVDNVEVFLTDDDIPEILRYLEYRGQDLGDDIYRQVRHCMEEINKSAKPKYIINTFDMERIGEIPKDLAFLVGKDIAHHLKDSFKIILFGATLGSMVENTIRRAGIKNVGDSVIMDSAASTLMELVCDTIDSLLREEYSEYYLTTRYSPGYGDLPIASQRDFCNILDTSRKIGVNVSSSGIMIPRKSVTAVIGVSEVEREVRRFRCLECNNFKACRFIKRGVHCGRKEYV